MGSTSPLGSRPLFSLGVACLAFAGCAPTALEGACPDSDQDGVCDIDDVCPAGDDREDTDEDGIPDPCDLCDGEDTSGDTDGDRICDDRDTDDDDDGCPDSSDLAPTVPDPDPDEDGLVGGCDPCPADAGNDADNDGSCGDLDCDDADPDEFPGQVWFPDCDADGVHDGLALEACDLSTAELGSPCAGGNPPAGGWSHDVPATPDCDDEDAQRFPGNTPTVSDGVDNDCDGSGRDECYLDADGDGHGTDLGTIVQDDGDGVCATAAGEAASADDCDDDDPDAFPTQQWFADCDGDGVARPLAVVACAAEDATASSPCAGGTDPTGGWSNVDPGASADCDDETADNFPGNAPTIGDGVDNDCDGGFLDECYLDADRDGHGTDAGTIVQDDGDGACTVAASESTLADDCDDGATDNFPGNTPTIGDGVDNDCDGGFLDECYLDADGDGHGTDVGTIVQDDGDGVCEAADDEATVADDCDDGANHNFPGNTPIVGNGVDNDCDGGFLDECYVDGDGDGHGTDVGTIVQDDGDGSCAATEQESVVADDCADGDPNVFPGNDAGIDDGSDNDCDPGGFDECYLDADDDGFGVTTIVQDADASGCVAGANEADVAGDCDDGPAAGALAFPGNTDPSIIDDGVDNDCDGGGLDECYLDADDDGFGIPTLVQDAAGAGCIPGANLADNASDCDDDAATGAVTFPGNTDVSVINNGQDNDCDPGGFDECYLDADDDGDGDAVAIIIQDTDGSGCFAGAFEADVANDCDDQASTCASDCSSSDGDGIADCADACVDADADDYGVNNATACVGTSCDGGAPCALGTSDCDEGDPSVNPGGIEILGDGVDQDCDYRDLCYLDADGDSFGGAVLVVDPSDLLCFSTSGFASIGGDCDDDAAAVHPVAVEICDNGLDDDCDGLVDCRDPECSADATCGAGESACADGLDDDGDGFIDCRDAECACAPPADETCDSGLDDDGDDRIDCVDPDCRAHPACDAAGEVDCTNGLDDDGDGFVDCADFECFAGFGLGVSFCSGGERCSDGGAVDEDGDGLVDCADPDCAADPACGGLAPEDCSAAGDEDGDGLVNCLDPDCSSAMACGASETACADGIDDDDDGFVDCADLDCAASCGEAVCTDLTDDDGDGLVDCADDDCTGSGSICSPGPAEAVCDDGVDDDGDGFVDCVDLDCATDPRCLRGVPDAPIDSPADHLVISEIARGFISNSCDYVELYNPTAFAVPVDGMSVQRQTPTQMTTVITLTGTVPAYRFYLVGHEDWSTNFCDGTGILLDAGGPLFVADDNAVFLVVDSEPVAACDDPDVIDLVGWGGHPCFETAPAIHPTLGSPIHRKAHLISTPDTMDAGGRHADEGNSEDHDNNAVDFVRPVTHPDPQHTGRPADVPSGRPYDPRPAVAGHGSGRTD